MEPGRAIQQLRRDARALVERAADDLDAAVPSCPGWTVRDVVAHTAEVYANKLAVLEPLSEHPPADWEHEAPDGDVVRWFGGMLDRLVVALRAHPASTPVWTWYDPQRTVGFWARRMAHETVIHRADVELAFGTPHHVDALVAADGIDEVLERFLCYDVDAYRPVAGDGQRVRVQTADEAWVVTLAPDAASVQPGAKPADATVAGTPSHVLYWLWGRLPDDAVLMHGEVPAAAALRRALAATTQ